jgi:hypothetical protein
MQLVNDRVFRRGVLVATFLATTIAPAETPAKIVATGREVSALPGYSLTRNGSRGDFDFLVGAWMTVQRRLIARGVGSAEWKDSPPNMHCATRYLDGAVTVEESYSPKKDVTGLFLYTFDLEKKQWSLYWIDPKSGKLDSPLVGGFDDDVHGEFYGDDVDDGRPVKVRYSWVKKDRDHARWEQAFSFDNRSWETNWTSEFTRTDPVKQCERNKGEGFGALGDWRGALIQNREVR